MPASAAIQQRVAEATSGGDSRAVGRVGCGGIANPEALQRLTQMAVRVCGAAAILIDVEDADEHTCLNREAAMAGNRGEVLLRQETEASGGAGQIQIAYAEARDGTGRKVAGIRVFDHSFRVLTEEEEEGLRSIATLVADQVELARHKLQVRELEAGAERLRAGMARDRQHLVEAQRLSGVGSWERSLLDGRLTWTEEVFRIFGVKPDACRR